jgi:hypothetical protein
VSSAFSVQSFTPGGAAVNYTTTVSGPGGALTQTGNTAPSGAGIGLLVKNASGSSINVQVNVPTGITLDGLPQTSPVVIAVANGADAIIPCRPQRYADPVTGLVTFGFSAVPTSVSVACVSTN